MADNKRKFSSLESTGNADDFENKYVHNIYEQISEHFSATRYKAWPRVAEFVDQSNDNAVVVDVGSGNGKSLAGVIGTKRTLIACDASKSLLKVAVEKGLNSIVCNAMSLPMRSGSADVALCIAMLHHLSTSERRFTAVSELCRVLSVGGQFLIYVWASNQRRFKNSTSQDVSVPWTVNKRFSKKDTTKKITKKTTASDVSTDEKNKEEEEREEEVHQRYYHLFNEGELEELMKPLPLKIVKSYYDCDNWCVIAEKTEDATQKG